MVKVRYGLYIFICSFFAFGSTVLATEEVPQEDIQYEVTISSNNTVIDDVLTHLDSVSSNNTVLLQTVSDGNAALISLADSVSSNNTALAGSLSSIQSQLNVLLTANAPTFYAYQLTDFYKDYFRGLLQNEKRCDYLAFALPKTHWNGSYNYSITHYYLVYNIKRDITSGAPVLGNYPVYDCYTENGQYKQDEYSYNLSSLPVTGWGSFSGYSALIDYSFDWRLFIGILASGVLLIIFMRRS